MKQFRRILLFTALISVALSSYTFVEGSPEAMDGLVSLEMNSIESQKLEIAEDAYEVENEMIADFSIDDDNNITVPDELVCDENYGAFDGSRIIYDDTASSNFKVAEFTEFDPNINSRTVCLIVNKHIPELEKIRTEVGKPIIIKSGSRSLKWDKSRGRSGNGQHVYDNRYGAADISVKNATPTDVHNIVVAAATKTNYTRIAKYGTFVHLDYGIPRYGDRAYYKNTKYGWVYQGLIKSS